jgi:hypothetical protein
MCLVQDIPLNSSDKKQPPQSLKLLSTLICCISYMFPFRVRLVAGVFLHTRAKLDSSSHSLRITGLSDHYKAVVR